MSCWATIPVALQLAGGDRRRHRRAVVVDDRVAAVLPALVLRALARPRLVLEIAVPVAIAVASRAQSRIRRAVSQWRCDVLPVAGPGPEIRQRDHEHQRAGEVGVVARSTGSGRAAPAGRAAPGTECGRARSSRQSSTRSLCSRPSFVSAASSASPRSTIAGLPAGGHGVAAEERRVERHAGLQRQPFVAWAVQHREGGDVPDVAADHLFDDAVARDLDSCEA